MHNPARSASLPLPSPVQIPFERLLPHRTFETSKKKKKKKEMWKKWERDVRKMVVEEEKVGALFFRVVLVSELKRRMG